MTQLLISFDSEQKPPLYTIERLSECMKTLLKQKVNSQFTIELYIDQHTTEVLDAGTLEDEVSA